MRLLNEDEVSLREAVRNWVDDKAPAKVLRKLRDAGAGHDPAMFSDVAGMGWSGVGLPEDSGGLDLSQFSLGLMIGELGRELVALPLGPSVQGAAAAIMLGGSDVQQTRWLPKIAEGRLIATLAIDEAAEFAPERTAMRATETGDDYVLSGEKLAVHEGMTAGLYVVAARIGGEVGDMDQVRLFLVSAEAKGLSRTARRLMDSRDYADLRFDKVRIPRDAMIRAATLSQVLDRVYALSAAEMMGLCHSAFDRTLSYLKVREQFGQVIGAFQALQHRMAEMFGRIQLTEPCIWGALQAIDDGDPEAPALASLAKAMASDLTNLVSREMVQLHGGIAMTDEFEAGFYIKRARVLERSFGTAAWHRARYARLENL